MTHCICHEYGGGGGGLKYFFLGLRTLWTTPDHNWMITQQTLTLFLVKKTQKNKTCGYKPRIPNFICNTHLFAYFLIKWCSHV